MRNNKVISTGYKIVGSTGELYFSWKKSILNVYMNFTERVITLVKPV